MKQCDVECGEGYQYRQVRCQSSRGTILPDKECSIRQRPRHVRKCEKSSCGPSVHNSFHRWRTFNWSAVSYQKPPIQNSPLTKVWRKITVTKRKCRKFWPTESRKGSGNISEENVYGNQFFREHKMKTKLEFIKNLFKI